MCVCVCVRVSLAGVGWGLALFHSIRPVTLHWIGPPVNPGGIQQGGPYSSDERTRLLTNGTGVLKVGYCRRGGDYSTGVGIVNLAEVNERLTVYGATSRHAHALSVHEVTQSSTERNPGY